LILVTVLLAGLMAACGGSDGDDGGGSSGDSGPGAATDSSSSASEGSGAAGDSDDESSEDASASDDSDDTASSSTLLEGCEALIFIFRSRPADNEVPFEQALDALRDMGEVESPIQTDLQLIHQVYGPFFAELTAAGVDNLVELDGLDEETSNQIELAAAALETPEVVAATSNIVDFINREC
jgi:hypothetical protein